MRIVGLDIGYGGLKVVSGREDLELPDLGKGLFTKRSTAAPADRVAARLSGDEESYLVTVGGQPWRTCFDPARVVGAARNLAENFSETQEYEALFKTGLLLSGAKRIDLLVTGLPVTHWKNEELRAKVEAKMKGVHQVAEGREVEVVDVKVIAQPYGSFVTFWVDLSDDIEIDEATVLVLDPGTYSVDWSVFSKMTPLADLNSSSTKASFVLLERVAALLLEERAVEIPVADIETRLISGKSNVLAGGEYIDLEPYLKKAAAELVPDVLNLIQSKVRQMGRTPDRVVLVGGGSYFYREMVEAHFNKKTVVVPANPVAANAIGFYYYGCKALEG